MNQEEYIHWLKHVRDNWSDEIPAKIVDSLGGQRYKVRKAWFQSLYNRVSYGINVGYVGEDGRKAVEEFREYAKTTDLPHRLTTEEDIRRANGVLDLVIASLEAKVPDSN